MSAAKERGLTLTPTSHVTPKMFGRASINQSNDLAPDSPLLPSPSNAHSSRHSTKWSRKIRKIHTITNALSNSRLLLLAINFIILLVIWVSTNVIWVIVSVHTTVTYVFFLDQCTTIIFLIGGTPLLLQRYWSGKVTDAMKSFPWQRMATIGLLDALYGLFTTVGSTYTPGPFQILLFQLPIPICMAASLLIYGQSYRVGQYSGAVLMFVGACVSILPSLLWPPDKSASEQATTVVDVCLYGLGVVFYSINSLYKEWALRSYELDVVYLLIIENWWNWFITFFLFPIMLIPGVSVDTPATVWPHFYNGFYCMVFGISYDDPSAICDGLWILTTVYSLGNLLCNIWMLIVIQLGSALYMNIVNALQLPLCNVFYAMPFIMGPLATSFTHPMLAGLIVTCFGFFVYQFMPLQTDLPLFAVSDEAAPVAVMGSTVSGSVLNTT